MKIRYYIYMLLCIATTQVIAQQSQPYMDVERGSIAITIDPELQQVAGSVTYSLTLLDTTTVLLIDAQSMTIHTVELDHKHTPFTYDNKTIRIPNTYQKGSAHTVTISYTVHPKQAMYFVKDTQGRHQIWTQGQGKYTSHWLPSFDDMNEKIIFDFTIDFDANYEVIANGKLRAVEENVKGKKRWHYTMKAPMSSYLVAIVIGQYDYRQEIAEDGTTLLNYYYPEDSLHVATTYKHNTRIFDFLSKTIQVPFPWQNYKQIPVKDFLYAGMENTGTTIFSDVFVVDEVGYVDRNYCSVNAHELAHQWFGNLVTATEGKHHWLQEGFATYYALLAEREIFGEDYFYYKLYESAEQLTALSKTDQATSVLDAKASSLTFYQRGAWVLHALRSTLGISTFDAVVKAYLEKFAFQNVSTSDFIAVAEEVSGKELSTFAKDWLQQPQFPSQKALELLLKSSFIKNYLRLAKERTQPLIGKVAVLEKALTAPVNTYLGQEVVYQLAEETSPEAIALYTKAFETEDIFVRQAIANTLTVIPKALQRNYETLLTDASYTTIEMALYQLWTNFPEDRIQYLEQTKTVIGFNDHNVRTLWLALALSTPQYHETLKEEWYHSLNGYTTSMYNEATRRHAFTYLENLGMFSDQSLIALVDGAMHHNWRFRKYCRAVLDRILKQENYKNKYVFLMKNLPKHQQDFLQQRITP